MSKTFKFGDGNAPNGARWDIRRGSHRPPAVWTRADLNYTFAAYCRTHTADQASEIFYHCARVTHPDHVPNYAFGAVISMMAQELADRPDEAEVEHRPTLRLPVKKDNA